MQLQISDYFIDFLYAGIIVIGLENIEMYRGLTIILSDSIY